MSEPINPKWLAEVLDEARAAAKMFDERLRPVAKTRDQAQDEHQQHQKLQYDVGTTIRKFREGAIELSERQYQDLLTRYDFLTVKAKSIGERYGRLQYDVNEIERARAGRLRHIMANVISRLDDEYQAKRDQLMHDINSL